MLPAGAALKARSQRPPSRSCRINICHALSWMRSMASATVSPEARISGPIQEKTDITRLHDLSIWVRIALAALAASRAQIASTILRCSSIACWVTLACE